MDQSGDIATGIGLDVGISAFGLLVALAPAVTGFGGVPATVCYIAAPLIAAAGLAGCTVRVDRLYKTQHYLTVGVGVLIAAIGVQPRQWFDVIVGFVGYVVACFGVVALFLGLGGVIGTPRLSAATDAPKRPGSSTLSRGETIQVCVAIACAVISTAIAIAGSAGH